MIGSLRQAQSTAKETGEKFGWGGQALSKAFDSSASGIERVAAGISVAAGVAAGAKSVWMQLL